jgi:hypothetical protein
MNYRRDETEATAMHLPRVKSRLSLAESMTVIAIIGIGLALPWEISIPVGLLGALWLIASCLPSRGAEVGMIVLVVLTVGLLWETFFAVGCVSEPVPVITPMMCAKPGL